MTGAHSTYIGDSRLVDHHEPTVRGWDARRLADAYTSHVVPIARPSKPARPGCRTPPGYEGSL